MKTRADKKITKTCDAMTLAKKNGSKTLFIRVVATVLILALAGSLGACKKKSKVPSKEAFLKEHQNDEDPHAMLDLEYGKSDLIKAWG